MNLDKPGEALTLPLLRAAECVGSSLVVSVPAMVDVHDDDLVLLFVNAPSLSIHAPNG
jgi:hypothetical protein